MSADLLLNVTHNQYHGDELPGSPRLSRSIAVHLLQGSPLRAWAAHPKLGGEGLQDGDPDRLDRGSLMHLLLLGQGQRLATIDANDWRTSAAKAAREEARANGLLPVLRGKYEAALVTAEKIRRRLEGYGVALGSFETEVTALWEEDGVACKARMDAVSLAQGLILDPKTVDRISLRAFDSSIEALGLDIQAAVYPAAVGMAKPALAGRVDLQFLLCETESPYDVAIQPLHPADVDIGRQRWKRALREWKGLLDTYGTAQPWPGYGRQEPREPKPWRLSQEFSAALASQGDPAWLKEDA